FARSAAPRNEGLVWAHRAAQPATCGVAILVPLSVLCNCGRLNEENTLTPGPAMSTFPRQENGAGWRLMSTAATDMIVGELPGASTGPGAELPAAATIRQPLLRAAWPADV